MRSWADGNHCSTGVTKWQRAPIKVLISNLCTFGWRLHYQLSRTSYWFWVCWNKTVVCLRTVYWRKRMILQASGFKYLANVTWTWPACAQKDSFSSPQDSNFLCHWSDQGLWFLICRLTSVKRKSLFCNKVIQVRSITFGAREESDSSCTKYQGHNISNSTCYLSHLFPYHRDLPSLK